jgi:uncharacterized membrane protein
VFQHPPRLLNSPSLAQRSYPDERCNYAFRLTPSENFGCNNNKSLQPSTSHSARTTRLLVSAAAALLVIASAGFGMLFAWQVGSKHDAVLGLLSVAMALGLELSKPFAISSAFASLRQWRVITAAALTLVGALAVGYSLQAELTFMSMTRGDLVAQRAGDRDAAQRAEERYRKAETDLAALKPTGTTKNATTVYLDRRASLEAELHQAEQDRRAAPTVSYADPGAVALATYAGALGVKTDAEHLGLWMPLIGVLALEIGAAFSVVLVRSVNGQTVAQSQSPAIAGDTVAHEQVAHVDNRKSGPPKRATKEKRRRRDDDQDGPPRRGLSGLLDAVQANGGVINLSQRKLARQIGASRTTLQRALNDLAAAGAVMLETGKNGTRLALAG